jgi:thioredoxin 1
MKQITSVELQDKIQKGDTFLLDLFATWCGPCRVLLKNLENLSSSEQELPMEIYSFDIDSDRDLVMELGVRSVPTVKVFKDGKEVYSKPGVQSVEQIKSLMESF